MPAAFNLTICSLNSLSLINRSSISVILYLSGHSNIESPNFLTYLFLLLVAFLIVFLLIWLPKIALDQSTISMTYLLK